tara:strand:- start:286 stop:477 length:192 start_codon:yes stop_codon:yes gene_type:complete
MAPVVTHRALGIRVAIDAAKASGSFALGIDLQNWARERCKLRHSSKELLKRNRSSRSNLHARC